MHTLLVGLLVMLGSILLALLGLYGVRRRVPLAMLQTHHEVGGVFISVLGVVYAVLLAFVVVVVWQAYTAAQSFVEAEAAELGDLFWMAQGLPAPVQQQVEEAARTYARLVVDEEWAAMAQGASGPRTQAALDALRQIYSTMEPRTPREAALYAESLTRLNDMSDSRRDRLLASQQGVLPVMWLVLLVGGLLTIGFTYFFGVQNIRSQALMTAILTAVIVLVLLLIAVIDYPFTGAVQVPPAAFEHVLERMEPGLGY